ncbi:MAG: carboxypeptidase regulatory-like domain-containing protein, partial [Candidatus Marinimicrobia bacterium]|nr:carboxypeptidase regulatory-like domain-containing protein [Candidatus Neomarinimicrobiota bacterium]
MRLKHIINKILLSLFTVTSITFGQTFEISGTIKDESGKKISNARLTLYSSKYQLVKTERTKGNGKFKFKKITPDKYTLNIYGAGGNSATKEIDLRSKSVTKLEVTAGQDDKQPQITVESEVGNVILKWEPINNTGEYIIFRDNTELTKTSKPSYKDKVIGGKSYAYNITAVDNNGEKGTRSLTEHGKALLKSPANIKALAKKNTISLSWDGVQNANSYNIYRDDDLINTTTELEYSDYKLKYDEDYAYTIVSVDHHKEEWPKSSSKSISTHKEVKKIKKIKAEAGESIVDLEWTKHDLAVKYKIYQNGTLIDSVKIIKYTAKTDPGTENCFTVSAVDKHGTEGPQSVPACDKAQFPPPEKISLILGEKYSDEMNSLKIKWDPVDGPASYNIYRDGKSLTNSKNTNYHDNDLDFGKEYTYEISSLSDDGLEGPLSEPVKKKTPKIFKINGQLINEKGQPKIEEAKVFLYNNNNVLWEEYTAGSNGKFTLENRIISGNYRIKVFGNGHGNNGEYAGNGGINITIKDKDESPKINLSTDGLRPILAAKRGVQRVLVRWKALPHAESYTVYKNNKPVAEKIKETKYIDNV